MVVSRRDGNLPSGGWQLTSVPKITALIHAHDDGARLGRLLDSLRPCDEVLVIAHKADEETQRVAREHGATMKPAVAGVGLGTYLVDTHHDWVLCARPNEALSEGLEAALFEWKNKDPGDVMAFSIRVREEGESGWKICPAETRLVNRKRLNWTGELPPNDPNAPTLSGDLLRFGTP